MAHSAARTRAQKSLALPLLVGFVAGVAGVIYLFSIPADPKNAIVLGFSTARFIEGAGLLIASLICLGLFLKFQQIPRLAEKVPGFLGWTRPYAWSIAAAWLTFWFSLLVGFYYDKSFPQYAFVVERILPVVLWLMLFSLAILMAYVFWKPPRGISASLGFLLRISFITASLWIVIGTILYTANYGLMLRQGSLLVLLILFFNLVFAYHQNGISGRIFGFLTAVLLFGGAIAGVWASAVSDLNIIAGLLPFNDANGYFHGGRVVAEGQLMFPFSAKRPLFPALMGALLWLTGQNLTYTIGLLMLIGGLAAYFSSQEIKRTIGAVAAAFFLLGYFVFYRRFIGSTMSEIIGLPLGALGFAFLWFGASRHRLLDVSAGMVLLSLGLLSRAGPFFILPVLIFWAGWNFRGKKKFNWMAFLFTGLAAGIGFGLNSLVFHFLAGPDSQQMSNFSYTIYGLVVGGKGWKQYGVDHPEVLALANPYQFQVIYRYAWEAFVANPFATVQGAIRYWGAFFSLEWYGAFGYIDGATKLETLIGRGVMALLSLEGVIVVIKEIRKPVVSMLAAGVIGILLSVPFVPPLDAEIRTYAAAIPWFLGVGMLGLIGIIAFIKKQAVFPAENHSGSKASIALWITSVSLIFLMVFAPILVHFSRPAVKVPSITNCPPGEEAVITTVNQGSYINILADVSTQKTWVPNIRYEDFNRSMHDSPMYSLAVQLMPVNPGNSFLPNWNWTSNRFENILAPTDMLDKNQGWVELCGWRETEPDKYGFFHAESASKLDR